MEEFFSGNGTILYLIACIAIISYTNFKDNQRMFLLYLFSYGVAAFSIFHIWTSLLLLLVSTFVFLEYLTEDTRKLELIVKLRYKVCDYVYMMFFQYDLTTVLFSFAALFFSRRCDDEAAGYLLRGLSLIFLIWGEHKTIAQPFKIKSLTDTVRMFDEYPPFMFRSSDRMRIRFALLCAIEDKSYFSREKSYSCFSFEYLRYRLGQHSFWTAAKMFFPALLRALPAVTFRRGGIHIEGRGFSTPEMQLIRTIGIARGYDKYKLRRKAYELVYSKLVFTSLKDYHQANSYSELDHYREYILWIYFQTVLSKIKGERYFPLSNAFENSEDIANWSMNGLFIACLGLSFRNVSETNLLLYHDIITDFSLSEEIILNLYNGFPNRKFPLSED